MHQAAGAPERSEENTTGMNVLFTNIKVITVCEFLFQKVCRSCGNVLLSIAHSCTNWALSDGMFLLYHVKWFITWIS